MTADENQGPGFARMIDHIDHIVLTTRDTEGCIRFYTEVLGMKLERFATPTGERLALRFGNQKINLHEWGREFSPRAHVAAPGTLDLCFIAAAPLEAVVNRLKELNVPVLEGPVMKTGATGPIRSVYVRDPDLNLIEISVSV
jgi:catechol 2,3-dioxygenase-like lactoylglutathione lyase family enzyme